MKQHWRSNSSFINFVRHIRKLLWAPSLLHSFVLCLVGDCGKIVIFAIFPKFASFANFYGPPSLLCALPRWRLWQNCHFRHICQIRRFRQLLWAPFTALCFALLAIVAKLSFSPYLPNSPLSPTFMGPLYCFVLCLVGDCGKIVIFAIFAKFAAFANFYGAPSLLCALSRWRLWQNCHFRHISQIRRFRQLLWGPFTAFCFASLAIVAKLSFSPYLPNSPLSPTFMGPLHCFVLCLVGDCGKIVIFAIFAKFAAFANFYGPPSLLCVLPRWRLWQNCHFRHICQIRRFRQLLWAPFTALCFAWLAIVAKLSFSPYLPNSLLSPTVMGPLHCFVLCLVGDCGKIVIFAIFAKFAAFANFYGAPILLCALPRWRLWQNCHFRHICQIRRFRQLLWGPFTALCFVSLAIVAKLAFSPYLPNLPTLSLFCNFCCCVHFWTYLVPSTGMKFEHLTLTLSRRHEYSAKQTTKQTFYNNIRKQPSLCIVLHLQARFFCTLKFSKLIPTVEPSGKVVFTNRKCPVMLSKSMHNESDISPVMNHPRMKRHSLS